MTEDVHCPASQPEDHNRDGGPGFCEDPDIYIEFDDGVFYQASPNGLEVAITADYPRLYPFFIVSVRRALERKPLSAILLIILIQILIGSAISGPYLLQGSPHTG